MSIGPDHDVLPSGYELNEGEEPEFRTRLHHTGYDTWSLSPPYLSGENDEEREYTIEYGCRLDVADAARQLIGALARVVAVLEAQPDDVGIPARSVHSTPIPAGMDPLGELKKARSLRLAAPSVAVDPDVHTPERVSAYLAARGWRQRPKEYGLWDSADDTDTVFVHRVATAGDYKGRTGLLACDLASIYGTGELQILADIAEATDA